MSPALTVSDPQLIKNILVKDFHIFSARQKTGSKFKHNLHPILKEQIVALQGDDWKRIRAVMSQAFTSGRIQSILPMVKHCVNGLLECLNENVGLGASINAKTLYDNFTVDVMAGFAFATQINSHKDPNNLFRRNIMAKANPNIYRLVLFIILPRYLLKVMRIYSPTDEWANQFFFNVTRDIIEKQSLKKNEFNNFIDLLLNAEKKSEYEGNSFFAEEDVKIEQGFNIKQNKLKGSRKALSCSFNKYITKNEILAQSWVIFFGGYETTATALTFALYELALNFDVQQRLHDEIMTAVDKHGNIEPDIVSRLPYLDAVISETLRMHSPALRLSRVANQDYKLGKTGIILLKNQSVEIPIHAMHYSEEYYDQPYRFYPERFLPENRHKLIPYTFLPFGFGPRNCIGMRFALAVAKLELAEVIYRFRFFRTKEIDTPKRKRNVFAYTSKKVQVKFERRF